MTIKEVKQRILTGLEPFAAAKGLKIYKGKFCLSRKDSNLETGVFFTYNTWGFEVQIFPSVYVDFKEIRDICERCGFHLNYTTFINLRLLERINRSGFNPDLRWQMQCANEDRFIINEDETDIDTVIDKISSLMPLALDFISQTADIVLIDRLFNTIPIERYSPYCSGLDTHCIVGLIAARLSGNMEYDKLRKIYERIVAKEDFRDDMKASFAQIVNYLDNYETDR